ncbi:MAG TPA: fasciclin domain-containing protein, partial [Flavisolibacter sp.]|nr:fasciclin domain-containing protein [Flavisolibacter sp.]
MNKILKHLIVLFVGIFLLSGCKKKFDEYYKRPDNLAPAIYQQLEARGNFKNLLAAIDKAGYKATLSAAGFWSFFAANDSAFQQFFAQRGVSNVSQLDSGTCRQIVTYALVYNSFSKARLSDYQANAGWVANQGFKRRTANYVGFYNDTTATGLHRKSLGANRNGGFILGDNNNKYIPYFLSSYMAANGLSAADYNYFYPNTAYTGFNVVDAKVVTADIIAENGTIHEIDKVLLPLPNIDQYLATNPQYSEFKKLFDKYMVQFVLNSAATDRYKILTGLTENVYIKMFNGALGFSPNNENYLKTTDNDGQTNGWTLFAPKNDVLLNYLNTVILENYPSLDQLPLNILVDFLNAHMWQTTVWPSKFASTNNVQSEPPRFDATADIFDKKILSNGLFYGTNKVQQANVFSTVYGRPYLDPKYLLMTRLLDENLRYIITVPTIKFTVIMMSDSVLKARGYDYNTAQSQWQYTVPGTTNTTVNATVRANLQRILAMHIIPTPNNELDNLNGSGIVETYSGDYIKYNAGKFISSGSQDS